MNAKITTLRFNSPFPDEDHAKEALLILSHTILLHRSTGHYQYTNNSETEFNIKSSGIIEETSKLYRQGIFPFHNLKKASGISNILKQQNQNQIDTTETENFISPTNIKLSYIRINCDDLDQHLKNEIFSLVARNSTRLYLNFYQNKILPSAGVFSGTQVEENAWEQYKFEFSILDQITLYGNPQTGQIGDISRYVANLNDHGDNNSNLGNLTRDILIEIFEKLRNDKNFYETYNLSVSKEITKNLLKLLSSINVNDTFGPQSAASTSYLPHINLNRQNLANAFETQFYGCQPFLFKFSANGNSFGERTRRSQKNKNYNTTAVNPNQGNNHQNFNLLHAPNQSSNYGNSNSSGMNLNLNNNDEPREYHQNPETMEIGTNSNRQNFGQGNLPATDMQSIGRQTKAGIDAIKKGFNQLLFK